MGQRLSTSQVLVSPWRAPGVVSAIVMGVLLALYLALAGWQGLLLLGSGSLVGVAMGTALLVFPIVGVWALIAEFRFGARATALVQQLTPEDFAKLDVPEGLTRDEQRAAAEALRPSTSTTETTAADATVTWQDELLWALALDGVGQRKDARAAVRQALRMHAASSPIGGTDVTGDLDAVDDAAKGGT